MSEPVGFYKDNEGRTRPLTAPEGQTYKEPPMTVLETQGVLYGTHDISDDKDHVNKFKTWGFYEKSGHLAFKHGRGNIDERVAEMNNLPEERLNLYHDRLHGAVGTLPPQISLEERQLLERIQQPMQLTPQVVDTQSQKIIRPEIPDFGVPIQQSFTSPTPPPFVGPTGKRLKMADVKQTMGVSRRVKELMEQGMDRDSATVQAIEEGKLVPYE